MAKKGTARSTNKQSSKPSDSARKRSEAARRLRQAVRIARALQIITRIQGGGRWNVESLAQELECSTRTIARDMQVLEVAGIGYYYDRDDECYRVRNQAIFPTLGLTEEEAIGQAVATAMAKAPGLDVVSGVVSTTRKVAAKSTDKMQELMADAERLVSVLDLKLADHSKHSGMIKVIQEALFKRKRLTGLYESPYESESVRLRLHPYRLCLIKNAWYLIARPTDAAEPRTYRVARFKSLRMLDDLALVPPEFDLREYFGNAWAVYRGAETYDIEVWFAPEVARLVTETVWHHTQKVKKHPGGGVTLTFRVDGLGEIAGWLLSWAGYFKIEKPTELQKLVCERLHRTLKMHKT